MREVKTKRTHGGYCYKDFGHHSCALMEIERLQKAAGRVLDAFEAKSDLAPSMRELHAVVREPRKKMLPRDEG